MKKWWIGCSGFHYKGWRDKFYPPGLPQRKWFEFYCASFNTVEINASFYRFPRLKDLKVWYDRSPADFRFTIKAPRLITHFKKFHNANSQARDFYQVVGAGLEDKLGSILFQLHPRIEYTEENLDRILETLDAAFVNVLEFRHPSWWQPKVLKTLRSHKVIFSGLSYPQLPDEVVKTGPTVYYRFHGIPELYKSAYTKSELQSVCHDIKTLRNVTDVFLYFNNDIDVAAVSNAKTLQDLV